MESLPVWKLLLSLAVPLGAALLLRAVFLERMMARVPLTRRSGVQFRLDLALFLLAALAVAVFNRAAFGFPLLGSGAKLVVGMAAAGFFAACDLALERERGVIALAARAPGASSPPERYVPLTRRFALVVTGVLVMFTGILVLLLFKDFAWLSRSGGFTGDVAFLQRSVLIEILFAMGCLMGLTLVLLHSYARNQRLLFGNQTRVLLRVSKGDLDGKVPVATADEMGLIAGHTNSMIDRLRDRERLRSAMLLARDIQRELLPAGPLRAAGMEVAGISRPSDEAGGDYFDYFELGRGHEAAMAALVGDVSGHGVGPAMLMAQARALIRRRAQAPGGPAEILADVNASLTADVHGTGRFLTLFLLVLEAGELVWVNAGHDPALWYRADAGELLELAGGGLPLGVDAGNRYQERRMPAPAGDDLILVGTDGVWETRAPTGEMFGKERLRELVAGLAGRGAEEAVAEIMARLDDFRGDAPQEDDVTLLVLRPLN